jgi:hypothetical protein
MRGDLVFRRERSYLKRNFFVYVNFSSCKSKKCAEGWQVAKWNKCKIYYSGETTLERRPFGGGDYRFHAVLSWISCSGNTTILLDKYRPECKGRSLCKVRKRVVKWKFSSTHSRDQSSVSYRGHLPMPGLKLQFLSCLVTIQMCRA